MSSSSPRAKFFSASLLSSFRNRFFSQLAIVAAILATMPLPSILPAEAAETKEIAVPGEYIVKFREDKIAGLKSRPQALLRAELPGLGSGAVTSKAIRRALLEQMGFAVKSQLSLVKADLIKLNSRALRASLASLKRRSDVEYVQPNYRYYPLATYPNDPSFITYGLQWGLHNTGQNSGTADIDINAPEAWDIATGSTNVVVAIVDEGVADDHPELMPNMWMNSADIPGNGADDDGNGYTDDTYGWNALNNTGTDLEGAHGSYCAGVIGAAGNNSVGIAGVNWRVKLMNVKFMSTNGGDTAGAIRAIDYVIKAKQRGANVRAINASWGGSAAAAGDPALKSAIDRAGTADILFVAAAGNSAANNDTTGFFPANFDCANIISVASVDRTGTKSSFSNYGPINVDIAAPGREIFTTTTFQYASPSGTSLAAPFVTGTAALIASLKPGLSAQSIKNIILSQVKPLSSLNGLVATRGMLDAFKAVRAARDIKYAISGRVTTNGTALAGVRVNGGALGVVNTAADGTYRFSNIEPGTAYTITVSKTGYVFASPTVSGTLRSDTQHDFTATIRTYNISGTVKKSATNAPLAGARVYISGISLSARTTDANGYYQFSGVPYGTVYTVYSRLTGYTFSPASTSGTIAGNRVHDFTGTLNSYTISGRVTLGSAYLSGVTINGGSLGQKTTDANGYYRYTGVAHGTSYSLTPSKSGYTFSPASASGTLTGNLSQNFAATAATQTYTVQGRVKLSNNQGLDGVTIELRPLGRSMATVSGGYWGFSNVPNGTSYTVVPSKTGYTFSPASVSGTLSGGNAEVNFTATPNGSYTISGRVLLNGSPLQGVTINGGSLGQRMSDTNGNFSFTGVANNTSYSLSPFYANHSFSPSPATGTVSGSNVSVQFTATVVQYQLQGRVTVNGQPQSGLYIYMTRSGQPMTTVATTGSDGRYSFFVAPGLTFRFYTYMSGVSFSPYDRSVTNASSNLTNQDFAG